MDLTRRGVGAGAVGLGVAMTVGSGPASAQRRTKMLDVIVLGAGVSGLNAAWLMEQQGLSVTVLEGRRRVGGRILTLVDQPGHPEMGFNTMGAGYGRGIDAARRAGVELIDVGPRFAKAAPQELVLDGRPISSEEWVRSPSNPFPATQKAWMPWEVLSRLLAETNPLNNWADWLDPRSAHLDISLHEFLKSRGLDDRAIRLAAEVSPYYGTNAYDISALMLEFNDGWVKTQAAAGRQSFAVKGGNEALPRGMAKLLKGDLLFGKEVVGISSDAEAATVACRDGSTYRARRVVCSLPFSTLRNVGVEPGLTGRQAEAVATLPYQPVSIAFLTVKSPYWEADKRSPSMWTNSRMGTVLAQRFGRTDDEVSGLMVQARGQLALYWDRLGREAALKMIVETLETFRPAAKGQVRGAALHSWGQEAFNAGDWVYFAPGQVAGLAPGMAEPAGRVHFCGEHTATANRGLEGALESSERVTLEIISA